MCINRLLKVKQSIFLIYILLIYHYSSIYDNYIFPGDFNMGPNCPTLTLFIQSLKCLIQLRLINVSRVKKVVQI